MPPAVIHMFQRISRRVLDELEEADLCQEAKEVIESVIVDSSVDNPQDDGGRYYLRSISAEGFRGIGPQSRIEFVPKKGLTLVVGGNGIGKSSFAEALERMLTGRTSRWARSPADAKENWRNVHYSGQSRVSARLVADDHAEPVDIDLEWSAGDEFEAGNQCARFGSHVVSRDDMRHLQDQVDIFPPLLSYDELDATVHGKPAELFDAFNRILGLGSIEEASGAIASQLYKYDKIQRTEDDLRNAVLDSCKNLDLPIANEIGDMVVIEPDIDALREVLERVQLQPTPSAVHKVLQVNPTLLDTAIEELEQIQRRVETLALDGFEVSAARVADLLELGLTHYRQENSESMECPLCGEGCLDLPWVQQAQESLKQLQDKTADRRAEDGQIEQGKRAILARLEQLTGLDPTAEIAEIAELVSLARRVRGRLVDNVQEPTVGDELERCIELFATVRAKAKEIDAERRAQVAPVVESAQRWIASSEELASVASSREHYEAAKRWLNELKRDLRDLRLADMGERTMNIWRRLSPGTEIELAMPELKGGKTHRRLNLSCQTEGVDASARSILSQGELHALALALFVPRALIDDSPFGFVLIDDPIHALDEIKIDGLAEVLHEIGCSRQVVVFTHDSRLESALEALDLPAEVVRLERGPGSVVIVNEAEGPIEARLREASQLAQELRIPEAVRMAVVAGCCRTALEEAAVRYYRRGAASGSVTVAEVEESIESALTLWDRVGLARYGPGDKSTAKKIEADYSLETRSLVKALSDAGHEELQQFSPEVLVGETRRVTLELFPGTLDDA